uniref:DNA mismatch repair proteins mutS family domain-containing protein n=1 Tax=Kalanchoe fedtschenkoi TaxID=63787 RepID=A0A7N0ZUY8_KALFE
MLSRVAITVFTTTAATAGSRASVLNLRTRAFLPQPASSHSPPPNSSSVQLDTLRVLEWDKLCHSVSSFATTSLGRDASKAQLWSLDQTYDDSMRLLAETNAAVEIQNHGGCSLDFSSINPLLVKSAVQHVRRLQPVEGAEALAIVGLLQLVENLQFNLRASIKEDSDWYRRFMPLTEVILKLVVNRSLIKSIQQIVDEDGSVKDSASPGLRRARDQVRSLEAKLFQLMDALIRKEKEEALSLEVSNINGRWCLQSQADQNLSIQGLLLSSVPGVGSIVEPLVAVPLNDELQQARASVARAEDEVLLCLTKKIECEIDDVETLVTSVVKLDVINARALYSLTFGGSCPDLILPLGSNGSHTAEVLVSGDNAPMESPIVRRDWSVFLPKAYHPLLVQQHHQNLKEAKKNLSYANIEIRRMKLEGGKMYRREEKDFDLSSLQMEVAKLEEARPVPVDIFIASKTRVLVITGPNTGGKTICLKTVGLAAMMAKSGLYVLSSEPARIPCFDFIFADIGDEQSLSQSLSTFSGHLKQINNIRSHATCQSLVLLDEVGAGTNPLEGAALGMALLESFAETGVFLTIATTHHGELKTLKYRYYVCINIATVQINNYLIILLTISSTACDQVLLHFLSA